MNKARERLFFGVSDMTAWKFAGINILKTLHLYSNKKNLHGRALQHLLLRLFDNIWAPGNELLYKILNTYEKQGYVQSYWEEGGSSNHRYIRRYKITDKGVAYLNTLKPSFFDTLSYMNKVFKISLDLLWGEEEHSISGESREIISSTMFTELNILNILVHHSGKSEPLYAKELQRKLSSLYNGLWVPSDGVTYPLLSQLENREYLNSDWLENTKKRTVRRYTATNKGVEYFYELTSPQSGLKPKIEDLIQLCESGQSFISKGSFSDVRLETAL